MPILLQKKAAGADAQRRLVVLFVVKDVTGESELQETSVMDPLASDATPLMRNKLSNRGIELINGRAAIMGILGLMIHEHLRGSITIMGDV